MFLAIHFFWGIRVQRQVQNHIDIDQHSSGRISSDRSLLYHCIYLYNIHVPALNLESPTEHSSVAGARELEREEDACGAAPLAFEFLSKCLGGVLQANGTRSPQSFLQVAGS